jgi:hypothetical protein
MGIPMKVKDIKEYVNQIIENSYQDGYELSLLDTSVLYKTILALDDLPQEFEY